MRKRKRRRKPRRRRRKRKKSEIIKRYYFDTSIWLDFFEDRNEPDFPKGELVQQLIRKIVLDNGNIVYSDIHLLELENIGYSPYEIEELFKPLKPILILVESTEKQQRRAGEIASQRKIPKGDVLHALLARDMNASMITHDKHFKEVEDIIRSNSVKDML